MHRPFLRPAIFACALLALPAFAQTPAPVDYLQAKSLADRDEASLPPDVAKAMRITQQDTLERGIQACATPKPDTSPFTVVARLDAAGTIDHTWRLGQTPLSICMEKYLRGKLLMRPVHAPFYVSYELSFTP